MDLNHGWVITLGQVASLLTALLELVIVAVLWRRRSLKLFPVFATFLVGDAARSVLLYVLTGSTLYQQAWVWCEPPMLCLQPFLVWELISSLYKVYPGINKFGNIAVSVAIAAALLLTVVTGPLDFRKITHTQSDIILVWLFQAERVLDLGLCIITTITVMLFPPQHYAHRVRNHGFLLATFFGCASAGFYAINFGFSSEAVGLLLVAVYLVLYIFWIRVFLAPDPQPLPAPSVEEVARLKRLNEDLLILARWLTSR